MQAYLKRVPVPPNEKQLLLIGFVAFIIACGLALFMFW